MKKIIGFLVLVSGIFGIIGSTISLRLWLITIFCLSLLKLIGLISIVWFAGPFAIGAISTGLWILFLGLIFMVGSYMISALGIVLLSYDK